MDVVIVESQHIAPETRLGLRALWDRAFGNRFTDHDAAHAYGGVHVLVRDGDRLLAHASAVPRRIQFGHEPWRTVGYVEAVATDPEHQRQGIGRAAMQALQGEVLGRWPVALLSTGRATSFYERLGWERWTGPSFTKTSTGVVANNDHGGLMVLRHDAAVVADLGVAVTCEDRSGDAW